MRFYFHPDAETELDRAVGYYESCRPGLGLELAQEVYAAVARIIAFPDAWSAMSENTRRCLVNRFPFAVIYQVRSGYVCVIAVADLRRRPGYWRNRSGDDD